MPAETMRQEEYWLKSPVGQAYLQQQAQQRKEMGSPYTGVQREVQEVRQYAQAHPERAIVISFRPPTVSPFYFAPPARQPSPAETILWERVFKPERETEETKIMQEWQTQVTQVEALSKEEFATQIGPVKTEARRGGVPEAQIEAWETEQWKLYEVGVSTWRTQEERKYGSWLQTWRKEWQPKGIAERLVAWKTPTWTPQQFLKPTAPDFMEKPLAPVAGITASFESFTYGIGQIAEVKTPRIPPTLTGVGLADIGATIMGKPAKATERLLKQYPREYVGGTVIGDVLLSIGLGKVVHKGAEEWLSYKYYKQPVTWKGVPEKILMKVTGAKPRLAYGEVAIPGIVQKGAFELELSSMRSAYGAFDITRATRTGGVWVGKYIITPKKPLLPHFFVSISRGFAFKTTFQEYSFVRERALTPLVSQTQVTRMGIYPYVPKVTSIGISRTMTGIGVGLGVSAMLKAPQKPKRYFPAVTLPKLFQPTFAYERIKYSPIQLLPPKEKERPVLASIPSIAQAQQPQVAQPTLPALRQVPVMKIPSPTFPKVPSVPTLKIPVVPPYLPRGGRALGFGRGKDLFGKWFKREHPIKSPEEMLKTFTKGLGFGLGSTRKKRRRKRRK